MIIQHYYNNKWKIVSAPTPQTCYPCAEPSDTQLSWTASAGTHWNLLGTCICLWLVAYRHWVLICLKVLWRSKSIFVARVFVTEFVRVCTWNSFFKSFRLGWKKCYSLFGSNLRFSRAFHFILKANKPENHCFLATFLVSYKGFLQSRPKVQNKTFNVELTV